jgi:hypothetical protein
MGGAADRVRRNAAVVPTPRQGAAEMIIALTCLLEFKDIIAVPRQVVQFVQRPADSVASPTQHESGIRRICGIRDLDRETAAILANDPETRSRARGRVFCAHHAEAHQHAITEAR